MKTLIVSLQPPVQVFVGTLNDGDLSIRGVTVTDCATPWPSVPDLLRDPDRGTLIGVTYQVSAQHRHMVQQLARSLSSDVVHYDSESARRGLPPYQHDKGEDIHHLEIIWSPSDQKSFVLAQLSEDVWYFRKQVGSNGQAQRLPLAFGLNDLDDVLSSYRLRLPDAFPFPRLPVSGPLSEEIPRRS